MKLKYLKYILKIILVLTIFSSVAISLTSCDGSHQEPEVCNIKDGGCN